MYTYIKKLQSKKEDTRKQILVVSLVACMSFVVFVWVYGLTDHLFTQDNATQASKDIKPFTLFANSISDTYQNISASVGKISSKKQADTAPDKQIDLIVVEPKTNQ